MRVLSRFAPLLAAMAGGLCAPLAAQEIAAEPASAEACLSVASDSARLACYDKALGHTPVATREADAAALAERFAELDGYQRTLYLSLVVLAVVATGVLVAPVSLHRVLFRKRLKPELVEAGNVLARVGLVVLALVVAGTATLLFDVVLSRAAGWVVGGSALILLAAMWWLLPTGLARRART